MRSTGFFTASDRETIRRAALLAEGLTQRYFNFAHDFWKRNPYNIFTRREAGKALFHEDAFASVVRFQYPNDPASRKSKPVEYGIVLHDPNILLAMLRSSWHDLWTLGLFIVTHELIHIVRFRDYEVDFFASSQERDREENTVQAVTRDILSGAINMDHILELYAPHAYPI
jgi:hypothetical protein